ncbi:MAG TPA: beta-galactosidase [Fimbriimonadaceae bacterium]|nr:beta-galactosidase [Fimbriimonadaceae bacterium]
MKPTSKRFPPLVAKFPGILHGGDYNPEQWPKAVWAEDDRLMAKANWNVVTLGIFSWVSLEPEEGRFTFEWLDEIFETQARAGRLVGLATPSAAAPAWLSKKYPETLRTGADGIRRRHGNRVNFCWTSPVYRRKTREMARRLAERYGNHPALAYWHVSNEFGGECYCELCQAAFREWLRERYGSLDALNQAYWTAFWSHTYTDWDQIEAPGAPHGETSIMGLTLDWKRFTTDQIVGFYLNEASAIRETAPGVPVTTNLMGTYDGLDPWKIAPHLDFAAWDSYPFFSGRPTDASTWVYVSFTHELNRSLKDRPFLLMESTPSSSNWYPVMRLKRPGMHRLEELQAVAHGADGVQYFQWRQGRGSGEQFHGAVVAHNQREDARVFREVAELGEDLKALSGVAGTHKPAEVALVYDWEVAWSIEAVAGPCTKGRDYVATVLDHYRPFWEEGVPADVISSDCDFGKYRLLIAPMLFMVKPAVAERLAAFVKDGGTLVTTYWSGVVDEHVQAFVGGYPQPLREALGIVSEEIDALYEDELNTVVAASASLFEVGERFEARGLCELIHVETAEVLATYGGDFYAGRAAVTRNRFGRGEAYYVASRNDKAFQKALLGRLIDRLDLERAVPFDLPEGVTATRRSGDRDYVFLLNCTAASMRIPLSRGIWRDVRTGSAFGDWIDLDAFGSAVLVFEPAARGEDLILAANQGRA